MSAPTHSVSPAIRLTGWRPPSSSGETHSMMTCSIRRARARRSGDFLVAKGAWSEDRSEEHTSELQSHVNLVCRLLLEKKKISGHTVKCVTVRLRKAHVINLLAKACRVGVLIIDADRQALNLALD